MLARLDDPHVQSAKANLSLLEEALRRLVRFASIADHNCIGLYQASSLFAGEVRELFDDPDSFGHGYSALAAEMGKRHIDMRALVDGGDDTTTPATVAAFTHVRALLNVEISRLQALQSDVEALKRQWSDVATFDAKAKALQDKVCGGTDPRVHILFHSLLSLTLTRHAQVDKQEKKQVDPSIKDLQQLDVNSKASVLLHQQFQTARTGLLASVDQVRVHTQASAHTHT